MNTPISLRDLPQHNLFRPGDVFVLFGELFGRGYANGLVNEARKAGMTRDELLRTLGRPSRVGFVGWQNQTVWNYRYSSPFCQWFQVGLSQAGIVEDTGYGPDPLCDDDDRPMMGLVWRHR